MDTYKLIMTTLSDTMLGSGESVPGIIDSDSRFDEYGLPYMHAKTLKGHLREQMKHILNWTGSRFQVNIDTLMGSSDSASEKMPGKLKFSDVRLSEGICKTVEKAVKNGDVGKEEIIRAVSIIYSYTKINDDGVAEKGTLRRDRMIRKGLILESYIYAEEPLSRDEYNFLEYSVQALQHIGTHKSKGKGWIRCSLAPVMRKQVI